MSQRWLHCEVEEWGRPLIYLGRLMVHVTDEDHCRLQQAIMGSAQWEQFVRAESLYQAAINTIAPTDPTQVELIATMAGQHEQSLQAVVRVAREEYQAILSERRVLKDEHDREQEAERARARQEREERLATASANA